MKANKVILILTISIIHLAINMYISKFYILFPLIPYYVKTINWHKFLIPISLSFIISILIAVNIVYTFDYIKLKKSMKAGAKSCGFAFAGLLTGVCPACLSGLLPLILGLVGISFSWVVFPLGGIEAQIFLIALLAFSIKRIFKEIRMVSVKNQ